MPPPPLNAFKIIVRVVNLVNRTTRVEIRDGKRIFGGKEEKLPTSVKIDFIEITEHGIRLDLPPRTCATGHKLELDMEFVTSEKTIAFHTNGTVEQVETYPNHHDNIVLAMNNYDANEWYFIQKQFRQRQSNVADLFERLKGNGK